MGCSNKFTLSSHVVQSGSHCGDGPCLLPGKVMYLVMLLVVILSLGFQALDWQKGRDGKKGKIFRVWLKI